MAAEKLTTRAMKMADLEAVEELSESAHFDVGLHNLQLYFRTSPTSWDVIENEKGEIVCVNGANFLSNGISYGYTILVRNDYRGRGLTRQFSDGWYASNLIGSDTQFSIERYKFDIWLDKRLSFFGVPSKLAKERFLTTRDSSALKAEAVTRANVNQVCHFDESVLKYDRSKFLLEWIFPDGPEKNVSRSAGVFEGSACIGYGTLRWFTDYFAISPLYATSETVARSILVDLLSKLDPGANLYIPGLASQRLLFEFAHHFGMTISETEMRNACNGAKTYVESLRDSMAKVYAVQEFWPL